MITPKLYAGIVMRLNILVYTAGLVTDGDQPSGTSRIHNTKIFCLRSVLPGRRQKFFADFCTTNPRCRIETYKSFIAIYLTNRPVSFYMSDKQKKKPCDMKPCEHLNDRAVEEGVINAKCNCPDNESCPKVRSTKRAVTRQCWRMRKPAQPVPA